MSVLFRVDGSPNIGLGHLQRCLSLASALRQFGVGCFFLTNDEVIMTDRVKRFGFNGRSIQASDSWTDDDITQTLTTADSEGCTAVVVDSDYEGAEYLGKLRRAGLYVCAIEDTAPHSFPCQLVVNGDAHALQLSYRSTSGDTLFLLGPEYSILRPEFWELSPRVMSDGVENILVTLGGSDTYNLMPRILDSLNDLPGRFRITGVIGPFFRNTQEIEAKAKRVRNPVRLIYSPDSVCNLMMESGIAISAGGQTLYELACTGCPTVAVRMAVNQDGQLQVFKEAGFIRVAGQADDDKVVKAIVDEIVVLLLDHQARTNMSATGQRLIDGQGALRVARTIIELANVKKREVRT